MVDVEHIADDLARAAGIPEAEREKFCRGVARSFERAAASDGLVKIKSAPEAITVREFAERLAIALKALPAATKTNVDHFLEITRPGKDLQIVDGRAVRAFTVDDLIRILEWIDTVASGNLSAHRGNEPRKGGCPRGARKENRANQVFVQTLLREIAYSGGTLNGKRLANTIAKLGIYISDRTLKRIAANVRQELEREFERMDARARQDIERINIQTEQRIEAIRARMAARASLFGKAVPKTRK